MSPASGRREPVSPLPALVREWAPVVVTMLGLLGYRLSGPGELLSRLDRDGEAQRVVDAQVAEAISVIGREACSRLGAVRAAAYGYPCDAIQRDARWPIAQLPLRTSAGSLPAPHPHPVAELALTALLVPAVPLLR